MNMQEKDFYRVKEICAYLKISRTALWKRIKNGTAPEFISKGSRTKGYSRETLLALKEVVNN